mmetsp:Transcript_121787/g.389402  ORF Transcript_121787/g.389402 Transcript_121787/m.389402 type:complete len:274 (-) Transcript_121787:1793-2614(-)
MHQHDGVPLLLQEGHPRSELRDRATLLSPGHRLLVEAEIPHSCGDTTQRIDSAAHATATEVLEVVGRGDGRQAGQGPDRAQDALRHGVVAGALQGAQQPPKTSLELLLHLLRPSSDDRHRGRPHNDLPRSRLSNNLRWNGFSKLPPSLQQGGHAIGREDRGLNRRRALRDCARLVEHDGVQLRGGLEGRRALHEAAALGRDGRGDHDRHGGRQAHGTRASDHQHSHPKFHGEEELERVLDFFFHGHDAAPHAAVHVVALRYSDGAREHQGRPD